MVGRAVGLSRTRSGGFRLNLTGSSAGFSWSVAQPVTCGLHGSRDVFYFFVSHTILAVDGDNAEGAIVVVAAHNAVGLDEGEDLLSGCHGLLRQCSVAMTAL